MTTRPIDPWASTDLEFARQDIHAATADQREHAGYYQDDATAMLANTAS
jgi:hypothetical protein